MNKTIEVWNRYDDAHDDWAYHQVVADLQSGGFGNPEADRLAMVLADWITEHMEGRWDSYVNLTMKEGFLELASKASS
ncbi:MAG: hypothetical protein ACKOS8_11375 [Gemmataceae bacterium]